MATCPVCYGAGSSAGGYKACASCGGSGHGSYTDQRCIACNGSGTSTEREINYCHRCAGTGHVPDAPSRQKTPAKTQKAKPRSSGSSGPKWGMISTIVAALVLLGGAGYLNDNYVYSEEWTPFAIAAVPSLIAGLYWKQILILGILGVVGYLFLTNV